MPGDGFDRLRPRRDHADLEPSRRPGVRDPLGRALLFSTSPEDTPGAGDGRDPLPFSASVTCSRCGERTALTLGQTLRRSVPSIYLPTVPLRLPRWGRRRPAADSQDRGARVYLRCPACDRMAWVRLRVNLAGL